MFDLMFPVLIECDGEIYFVNGSEKLPVNKPFRLIAKRVITGELLCNIRLQLKKTPVSSADYDKGYNDGKIAMLEKIIDWNDNE